MTTLLTSWADGDPRSEQALSTTLYRELRAMAKRQLSRQPGSITLDTNGLIHEAYLKLVDGSRARVRDRGHFLALSARVILDEALEKLKTLDPRGAKLVELRFFGGLSLEEAAEVLDVSIATLKRHWERTRAYLYGELRRPAMT